MILRIETCLPSKIEQQIYLEVGHDFGIKPESFARILEEFLGQRELKLYDFDEKGIAKETFEYLLLTLNILFQDRKDWDFRISVEIAAKLGRIFGENALNLLTDVYDNLEKIKEIMGWSFGERRAIRMALKHIIAQEENAPTCVNYNVLSYFRKDYQLEEWGLNAYE